MENGAYKRKVDKHAKRVYDFESACFNAWARHVTSVHQLRVMSKLTCEHFELPPVPLELLSPRSPDRGVYDDDLPLISLCPKQGRNAFVLAHELAHHYCYEKHPRATDHGPTFVRALGEILAFLGVMPIESFRAAARKHGLR